jgi:hypothetical protein
MIYIPIYYSTTTFSVGTVMQISVFIFAVRNISLFENSFDCHYAVIRNMSAVNWIFCVLQVLYEM